MRALTRDRNAVHRNFIGSNKKKFERELLENQRKIKRGELEKHDWVSDRWKAGKDQLKIETGGKCAYCEAPTGVVYWGDVEHYRPKSKYWWLAYSYDNYLFTCVICNSKFKSNRFPIKNSKLRGPVIRSNTTDAFIDSKVDTLGPDPQDELKVGEFEQDHDRERPYLPNPYFDPPEQYLCFMADDVIREVDIVPNPEDPDAERICSAVIQYYGLNRKELRSYRFGEYRKYRAFRMVAEFDGISDEIKTVMLNEIEIMKADGAAFSGMIRYFDGLPNLG